MFCRFCATPNDAGATHCRACAAPLPPDAAPAAPDVRPAWQAAPSPGALPPVAPAASQWSAASRDKTLADVVRARGGALSETEAQRYVEAVARALAQELSHRRAPTRLELGGIFVREDGALDLRLEWHEIGPRREVEAHLARELERLSDTLLGRLPTSEAAPAGASGAPASTSSVPNTASAVSSAAAAAGARARIEKVGFFDTARDLLRLALAPAPPPEPRITNQPKPSAPAANAAANAGTAPAASPSPGAATAASADAGAAASAGVTPPASTAAAPASPAASPPALAPTFAAVKLDFERVRAVAVRTWARGKSFSKVDWGRDGREVWGLESEGALSVWSAATGTNVARMDAKFRSAEVCAVAFSPRDEMAATGHEDGRLCLWLPRQNRLRASLEGHAGRASALAFAAPGNGRTTLYSGGGDATLRAWDALEKTAVGGEVEVGLLNVREATASTNGEMVALGGDGGRIEVWRFAAARKEWSCAEHEFWITSLAFSPDGRILASGGYDRSLRLWAASSGVLGREFRVHDTFVCALAWSPQSQWLFSLSADGAVWMHDWKASRSRQILHESALCDLALHPDGRHLACAGPDGLSLWRLE
jgi:WD40 repeat protein